MKKSMNLSLLYAGGVEIDREIEYDGENLEDIAKQIDKDENDLLYYMRSADDSRRKEGVNRNERRHHILLSPQVQKQEMQASRIQHYPTLCTAQLRIFQRLRTLGFTGSVFYNE